MKNLIFLPNNQMAKDPAFLFYHEDFFSGVSDMTNEEVGAFIRCMCVQASKGGISESHMKKICESHEVHMKIISKFIFNSLTELFQNERLKIEVEKRKAYTKSRANNRLSKKNDVIISETYEKHMENENENENIDKGKGVQGEKPLRPEQQTISFKHNAYAKECETQSEWINTLEMQKVIKPNSITIALKNFNLHLIAQSENKTTLKDYKSHFVNWMNKRNQQKTQTESKKTSLL